MSQWLRLLVHVIVSVTVCFNLSEEAPIVATAIVSSPITNSNSKPNQMRLVEMGEGHKRGKDELAKKVGKSVLN